MGKRLIEAGILCEVRSCPAGPGASHASAYRELWVKAEQELQWATALVAMHCPVARN